ncbi:EutP/PduV family microcompartment system protein [Hathewaya limosa]|uniref:Ethanolamine utilization protein EutP n=1 Tax=Hathewaya limosa TaxID=1536 RepID=A0ABU0JVS3_HATLI|nr:EutP/PduV family microcompartment system protein [Hathewaya limosa]AWZ47736.1 ethanolamine utilization protein EutP [Clostridiaceae bacterium 14S0207]MDQ0480012.1 ethanolamine utilization protein EutP [Hathewaya limosa]
MKKIMLVGKTGCGKTTLTQVLHNEKIDYKKTQALSYGENSIDTPGEYIENRGYYKALIVTSADSDVIGLLQDCTQSNSIFPPSFGSMFPKPVVGIITKIDQCNNEENIKRAEQFLKIAGVQKIFKINSLKNEGIEELVDFLNDK